MDGLLSQIEQLAEFLDIDSPKLLQCWEELQDSSLTSEIQERAQGVAGFEDADLADVNNFHLFRTILYLVVRAMRPRLFLETGVLNGFSSAFILEAMACNKLGRLISIDLPSRGLGLEHEKTADLPAGQRVGWGIPERLCDRHELLLGRSEVLLPRLLSEGTSPDVFMHDSCHSYNHVMMEISIVYSFLEAGSIIIVDNTELNQAFHDFCVGNRLKHVELSSYSGPERIWKHGLARR